MKKRESFFFVKTKKYRIENRCYKCCFSANRYVLVNGTFGKVEKMAHFSKLHFAPNDVFICWALSATRLVALAKLRKAVEHFLSHAFPSIFPCVLCYIVISCSISMYSQLHLQHAHDFLRTLLAALGACANRCDLNIAIDTIYDLRSWSEERSVFRI